MIFPVISGVGVAITVTEAVGVMASLQVPFLTTARYLVEAERFNAEQVSVVLGMSVAFVQRVVVFCHLTTFPEWPDNVNSVAFLPEQTVVLPEMVPGEVGVTVIKIKEELTSGQAPLFTMARK